MKKVFAVIFAAMLAASMVGCSSTPSTTSAASTASTAAVESKAAESKTAESKTDEAKDSGTLGDYSVAIESARLSEDYESKPVVVVKYKFTNNSEKASAFITTITNKAFQDGVELPLAMVNSTKDTKYNAENSLKEIKKGASIEVEEGYKLTNQKSKIQVEVNELISMSKDKLSKTFDATALK